MNPLRRLYMKQALAAVRPSPVFKLAALLCKKATPAMNLLSTDATPVASAEPATDETQALDDTGAEAAGRPAQKGWARGGGKYTQPSSSVGAGGYAMAPSTTQAGGSAFATGSMAAPVVKAGSIPILMKRARGPTAKRKPAPVKGRA
jgi:hypothetical protein